MADFNDGKDRSAFRTIGEVSDALGIKPHVLRYWEQQFSLLKPLKRSGGRRHYRPSDVEMVEKINRLVNEEGYTLKGAEAVLRSSSGGEHDRRKEDRRAGDRRAGDSKPAATPVTAPQVAAFTDMRETIAKLKDIRARLARAIEA
jgi:DNA-binding transcriptional MerR regulator